MTDIRINETIEDKKSWFNIKRFRIGDKNFDKPEKSLDIKNLDADTYHSLKDGFKFCEASKLIKNYGSLVNLYKADDNQSVDNFFVKRDWLSGTPNIINFTFQFNPFVYVKKIDDLSWFFNYYYPYSRLFLTVPNIRFTRTIDNKVFQVIDLHSYMQFVDSVFKMLDEKNNKPIFVPVSMRMGMENLTTLIQYYLKNEHYYFWFDFEGRPISEKNLGRLRHVFDLLKASGNFKNSISYFTNIKREILSNSHEKTSVASDALSAVAGANLIGVNREPLRYDPKMSGSPIRAATDVDPNHKARLFDHETYFYIKTTNADLFSPRRYVPINAARLNTEFAVQSDFFLQNQNVDTLLNKKIMFKDEKAGNVLKGLTSKSVDSVQNLIDFM